MKMIQNSFSYAGIVKKTANITESDTEDNLPMAELIRTNKLIF